MGGIRRVPPLSARSVPLRRGEQEFPFARNPVALFPILRLHSPGGCRIRGIGHGGVRIGRLGDSEPFRREAGRRGLREVVFRGLPSLKRRLLDGKRRNRRLFVAESLSARRERRVRLRIFRSLALLYRIRRRAGVENRRAACRISKHVPRFRFAARGLAGRNRCASFRRLVFRLRNGRRFRNRLRAYGALVHAGIDNFRGRLRPLGPFRARQVGCGFDCAVPPVLPRPPCGRFRFRNAFGFGFPGRRGIIAPVIFPTFQEHELHG